MKKHLCGGSQYFKGRTMSIKLNWEMNYLFSKPPSAVFFSARWMCAVQREAGYSSRTVGSDVFGRHLLH